MLLNKTALITFTVAILTTACSSKAPPPIMTDEKFDSRVNAQGQVEFAYGISWRNTSEESLLRDGRLKLKQPKERDRKYADDNNSRFGIQANNHTKLDLEDKAAGSLKKRLDKEGICLKGYDIDKVIWKADNIRLLGYCL